MIKRFLAMPSILKLLTATGLAAIIAVIGTMLPQTPIYVFGRQVSQAEWWNSGAGPYLLIVALLMGASSVMMLLRARHARLAYVVAWVAMDFSIPFVVGVIGSGGHGAKTAMVGNLILTALIALYLYLAKGCRHYFGSSTT